MAINGGGGDDNLIGTVGDDLINGLAGNDTLDSNGGGIDTLFGGIGNDVLYAYSSNETHGDTGDDLILIVGDVPAILDGGDGNDTLQFNGGFDISGSTIIGIEQLNASSNGKLTTSQLAQFTTVSGFNSSSTSGSLILTAGGTASVSLSATLTSSFQITGSSEAEKLTFDPSYTHEIIFYGGGGNDKVTSASGDDSLRGDQGDDTLIGNDGNDSLDGGIGSDSLSGGTGNDFLITGGNDSAFGGSGNDLLSVVENGPAVLSGGSNVDVLRFEGSFDISAASLSGDIEHLDLLGNDSMTAAQLATFALVEGYNGTQSSASLTLTAGGTATVALAGSLSSTFSLTGSQEADLITFVAGHSGSIQVFAGAGDDSITGSTGNDSLRGDEGNDTLNGSDGNDSLDGSAGHNVLNGGNNDDFLVMRAHDDAFGGSGNDLFSIVTNQPNTISGGVGSLDQIRFEGSYDISNTAISGVEQLDLLGSDSLTATQLGMFAAIGGYNDSVTNATVSLTQGGTAVVNLKPTLTTGFTLIGSNEADIITFAAPYDRIVTVNAGGGDDSITGALGGDSLNGGDGNDTLLGQAGNDSLDGGGNGAFDQLFGGTGNDVLIGHADDMLFGGNNDDLFSINSNGVAVFDGGTGNDTMRFETSYDISGATVTGIEQVNLNGNDEMTATQLGSFSLVSGYGAGNTTATLFLSQGGTANVTLSPTLTVGFTLFGSDQADLITFTASGTTPITVHAGAGDDSISGAKANDTLIGDAGNDTLNGSDGNDSLDGGVGADSLLGGNGDDFIVAGSNDSIFGGSGNDFFSIQDNGVSVLNGGLNTDTLRTENSYDISGTSLISIENLFINGTPTMTATQLGSFAFVSGYGPGFTSASVALSAGGTAHVTLDDALSANFTVFGSSQAETLSFNASHAGRITIYGGDGNDNVSGASGNDYFEGGGGNDSIFGLVGNDTIFGQAGADVIAGGAGADTMSGGSGQDIYSYASVNDSTAIARDVISDFEGAGVGKGDKIDLSAIDADGGLGTQDSFIFGSTGLAGVSLAEDGAGNTLVQINTNNSAAFEMIIVIADGATLATSYTASDFIL